MSTEVQSLDNIDYRFKIKKYLILSLIPVIFVFAFLSNFPISSKIDEMIQDNLKKAGCPATFTELKFEFLLPKIVVSNLSLPRRCTGGNEDLFFKTVTLNYHLISFAPFGIPFRIDTKLYGQDLALYFVQGIVKQSLRLKDQKIDLSNLSPLMPQFKLKGRVTVDMKAILEKNDITDLTIKASSDNFEVPGQTIQGFSLPNLALKDVFLDAQTEENRRLKINKLIIGGTNEKSPIRAKIDGHINLSKGYMMNSSLSLKSEVSISNEMKQNIPLLDIMLENYEIKDGFYQIQIGGTLGSPSFK